MSSVLNFENVTVKRNQKSLISEVSFQVNYGEHWVILGRNGAGKTTIAKLISTQLFPTSGTVDILGERLGRVDTSELKPRIGFLSGVVARSFPGHETVIDVVLTAAYGMSGRWKETYDEQDIERARALLNQFGVLEVGQRTFNTLSDGEQKRVLLARAMMSDPEILLLDEPSAGLDLVAREELIASLDSIAASLYAPALVIVTHHLEEIPRSVTHGMILNNGKVVAKGPISEVLSNDVLSTAYEVPLVVENFDNRWFARKNLG